MLITLIVYSIGYLRREQKWLFSITAIVSDIALLYIFFDSLRLEYGYYALAAAIALLAISMTVSISRKFSDCHFEVILEPVKIIVLAYAIYNLIYRFDYTEEALFLAVIGLIFALVCIFRKNFMKKIYFVGTILAVVISMSINVREFAPIVQVLDVIALSVLLIIAFKSSEKNFAQCREFIYGLMLVDIALVSLNTFGHFDLEMIGIILLTVIYTILFVAFNKNDIFRCFTIVALLIPYVIILPISVWNDNINYIFYSLPWLALIFVYTRGFMASAKLKLVNLIEIITLSVWYLTVSSKVSLEIAVFIGIISFIALLIGYKSEKWISLYYTGVAFLIINTIFQLKEFWTSIPIWAYILIAGLALIGIVTYKEYARINKKEFAEKVDAEIVEQPKEQVISNVIDTRAIIAGSVLYVVVIPILLEIIV